jgi:hypothetical protein
LHKGAVPRRSFNPDFGRRPVKPSRGIEHLAELI